MGISGIVLDHNSQPDLLSELAFEERGLDAVIPLDITWQLLKPWSGQLSYTLKHPESNGEYVS